MVSDLMSLTAACDELDIHKSTGYQLVKDGKFPIPVVRVGGGYKVSRTALNAFLARARGEEVAS